MTLPVEATKPGHSLARAWRRRRVLALGAVVVTGAVACTHATAGRVVNGHAPRPADLVFVDGAVYTVDAARSWATAVAVRGDRIVYVGTDDGARPLVGARTRVVDLAGRMLLPGFIDSHVHPGAAGVFLTEAQLDGLATREEILAAVRAFAAAHPDAPWILGAGWNESAFLPSGLPTREMLDAVVTDRPVFLENNSGHACWVNSKALAIAGIDAKTADPPGGRIERGPDGTPTGVLQEYAMDLVMRHRPPRTAAQVRDALATGLARLERLGVTGIVDAFVDQPFLAAYQSLDEAGELRLRTIGCLGFDPDRGDEEQLAWFSAAHAASSARRGRFSASCVKFLLDGVPEHHTAAMLQPYADDPSFGLGPTFVAPERLTRLVTRLDAAGFDVHMHTIGDRAVREGLDAIAAARAANGARDRHPTLAHLGLVDPADLPRFRELGVVANMTPLWSRGDDWETVLEPRVLGAERASRMLQTETILRAGAVLAWGTDWPVTSAEPLAGIETAVTRRFPGGVDPQGKPDSTWFPDERTTLEQAIAAYTVAGAYLAHADRERGSIEPGKLADLVVLSRNLFVVEPLHIHEVSADFTVIGGRVVYARDAPH